MWGLPIVASAHGHEIDTLILLLHLLALVLFVGWGIFFLIVLVRFRKSVNPKANYHGVQGHASTASLLASFTTDGMCKTRDCPYSSIGSG